MKKKSTSNEDILAVSKKIVMKKGIQAINMRDVASQCHVALGSIYNYYPSKSDLIVAVVESIWQEIFLDYQNECFNNHFLEDVELLFDKMKICNQKYLFFFSLHPMSINNSKKIHSQLMMAQYVQKIKDIMLYSLNHDQKINHQFFHDQYTKEKLIDFVFFHMISSLLHKEDHCDLLIYILKNAIY